MHKDKTLTFYGFGDGMNSADPPTKIGDKYRSQNPILQCQVARDVMLKGTALVRRPGSLGLTNGFGYRLKGLGFYRRIAGTETLIAVESGGKIYTVGTDGTLTELDDIGGTGEAWMSAYMDKMWGCNGNQNFKIEGTTVYQIGIDAPTGVSAAAASGGSLADGVYQVYACYARTVSGTIRLYGPGQDLGTVTLSGGNSTVSVTGFADSSDAQADTKVIFMSDAGGSSYYFYGSTDSGTTITISDTTDRNASILYSVVAASNIVPSAFTYLTAFDKRIWGATSQYLYYSYQAGTVYDLERFESLNYIEFPYEITGLFTLGEHLYVNTPAGLIRQPYGDVSARFEHVEKRYNFKYPRTVAEWSGTLIGLTQDGVRLFDGEKMSSYDISRDVKTEIQRAVNGWSADDRPCGAVLRRDIRTEYHLCYRNTDVCLEHNNRRLVLNLDRFTVLPDNRVIAPWETWSAAGNYMAVDNDNVMYTGQSTVTAGVVYKERTDKCYDENVWIAGTYESKSVPAPFIKTGVYVYGLSQIVWWRTLRILANLKEDMTVSIYIWKYPMVSNSTTIDGPDSSVARFDVARFGVDTFAPDTPSQRKKPLPMNLKGYAMYAEITQAAEDKGWEVYQLEIDGQLTQSRFT